MIDAPINDWTRERLLLIEDTLAADYEKALPGNEGVEESIEITLEGEELEAMWEIYNRYKSYVMGAVMQAYHGEETEVKRKDVEAAAPQIFVAALGEACYSEKGYQWFAYNLFKDCRDRTWQWIARRTKSLSGGTSHLARLARRELRKERGPVSPREFAEKLREEKSQAARASLDHVEEKVRDVLRERSIASLDERLYDDSKSRKTLANSTAADNDERPQAKEIGEALAQRWGMEETWKVLMRHDRSWSENEIEMLGTDSDAKVAIELNRTQREVRYKREELGIEHGDDKGKVDLPDELLDQLGQKPDGQLADEYGHPRTTIANRRQRRGIDPAGTSGRAFSEEEAKKIRERYEEEDIYQRELAEEHGASRTTIHQVINEKGPYSNSEDTDE